MVKRGARFVEGAGGPTARTARYAFAEAFSAQWDHAFQVPRDRFDELLLRRAGACGADVREGCEVTRVVFEGGRAVGVEARVRGRQRPAGDRTRGSSSTPAGATRSSRARPALVAAHRAPRPDGALHAGARRLARRRTSARATSRSSSSARATERGWFWLIPFRDGRTSVGAVVSGAWIRARQHLGGAEALFDAAVDEAPTVAWMLEGAERVMAAGATADFSFRVGALCGDGWVARWRCRRVHRSALLDGRAPGDARRAGAGPTPSTRRSRPAT